MPPRSAHPRHVALGLAACAVVALVVVFVVQASGRSPRFSATGLTASVAGTTVTASVTVASNGPRTAELAGVCARGPSDSEVDFPLTSSVRLDGEGTTLTGRQVLDPGRYRYWACVKSDGVWHTLGSSRRFTVHSATPSPTPTAGTGATSAAPSQAMPVGDLPGWQQIFAEDFTTPVAAGGFPGPYAGRWMSYNGFKDTSGNGYYDQSIISAHDGYLDLYLHTSGGRALGAAPIPLVGGHWGGQTYGRYSVRLKADPLANFGISFLLWPDSNDWHDGEIDFPEGSLNQTVKAYNHCGSPDPGRNCFGKVGNSGFTQWHTYTIEWTPKKITFLIDGTVFGSTTEAIPRVPMHLVIQVGTSGGKRPAPSVAGHLLIDWVTIYSYHL